jgi:hypothetical protein
MLLNNQVFGNSENVSLSDAAEETQDLAVEVGLCAKSIQNVNVISSNGGCSGRKEALSEQA